MIDQWKAVLRHHVLHPARYRWDEWRTNLETGRNTRHFLLVTDGKSFTSDEQYAPLKRYAVAIRRRFGVVFRPIQLAEALTMSPAALARFAVVGLKLDFRTPEGEARRIAESFRDKLAGSRTKLVYFDGDDDQCVQWPAVLRASSLYVKKHCFKDLTEYRRCFPGKSNLTDYVARQYGTSFESNIIPRSGVLTAEDLPKLHLGWNIGLDDKIINLYQTMRPAPASEKQNDLICRATVPPGNWLYPLRNDLTKALEPIASKYRVLLPTRRVSQEQYYSEMHRSRICISPLGYGELCWRDFESILCCCLLVKPDMSHVRTIPDIFGAGETYVPVRWDYSDLVEKCEYYLNHGPERIRIVERAYGVLSDYYRSDRFLESFSSLLERLDLQPSRR